MSFIVVLLAATTTGLVTNTRSSFEELKDEIKHASIDENSLKQSSYIKSTPTFLSMEDEIACPPGKYCPNCITGDPYDGPKCKLCPAGNYCVGEWYIIPCPSGTFNPNIGSPGMMNCDICPPGSYCSSGSSSPTPCPAGTYNMQYGGNFCFSCPEGSYCVEGSSIPTICNPGTYNPNAGSKSASSCLTCNLGYYCPQGSANGIKCPSNYNNYNGKGLSSENDCYLTHFIQTNN